MSRHLADDFPCFSTDYITDIHIWGSWLNDILPGGAAPNPNVAFVLANLP
jgi:hypothetical protein